MKESKSNGLEDIIAQAIEEMKSEQGNNISLERVNLAELERRTGISRAKLRLLKAKEGPRPCWTKTADHCSQRILSIPGQAASPRYHQFGGVPGQTP